jgi:hypothetical protein
LAAGGKIEVTMLGYSVPRGALLSAWTDADWSEGGVQIDRLEELTTLAVKTARSLYEITVLNGNSGEVLVRGGEYFPQWTAAVLSGSSFGGSILKCRGIYIGMRMEFVPQPAEVAIRTVIDGCTGEKEIAAGLRVLWTSPVQSFELV